MPELLAVEDLKKINSFLILQQCSKEKKNHCSAVVCKLIASTPKIVQLMYSSWIIVLLLFKLAIVYYLACSKQLGQAKGKCLRVSEWAKSKLIGNKKKRFT